MFIPKEAKHSLAFRNAPIWSGIVVIYVFLIAARFPFRTMKYNQIVSCSNLQLVTKTIISHIFIVVKWLTRIIKQMITGSRQNGNTYKALYATASDKGRELLEQINDLRMLLVLLFCDKKNQRSVTQTPSSAWYQKYDDVPLCGPPPAFFTSRPCNQERSASLWTR